MREWQVGDPVGDGNDICVPDVEYMRYLRDRDDFEDDMVDDFKRYYNTAKRNFKAEKYEKALYLINDALRIYSKMNDAQKSCVRDSPFDEYWIINLCSKIINANGNFKREATDFITKNRYDVNICEDCDHVYPFDRKHCTGCGKPLRKLRWSTPEMIASEIPGMVGYRVFDDVKIQALIDR